MGLHTILGAGGSIANELARLLVEKGHRPRLVSRNPRPYAGADTMSADVTDLSQALTAIQGSEIVYLCVGLKYDYSIWRQWWPKIMDNTIEGCRRAGSKLIFFDNVYMYGLVDGWMTEDCPYNPVSRKGDLRARIATRLMSEVRKGNITATIARAADFYGPDAQKTGIPNLLVFDNFSRSKTAQWMCNPDLAHSFTYTPDAARGLYQLATTGDSWNQVWHLPTDPAPLTGRDLVRQVAGIMGRPDKIFVLRPWMLQLGGLFDRTIRELVEMSYQYSRPYLFSSAKFDARFGGATSYREGLSETAKTYIRKA